MSALWEQLQQRKLVQWALAYVAFAFALLQGIDIVATRFDWPPVIERGLIVALCIGFFVVLVVAWYHGERGEQRVTGMEIILLAVLLAIGGGLLLEFSRAPLPGNITSGPKASASAGHSSPQVMAAPGPGLAIPTKSIAVLPFENLSGDKGNKYFTDGIQDLILTKLADIGDLKVISRTSTMKYASHPDDLKTIAMQLSVANILEGSVQKAGNSVLINVQLIAARTDAHIWAQAYTRTLDNVFGVEGEVAEKIADALKAKLSPAETKRLSISMSADASANDLFLRAEYFTNRGDVNHDGGPYRQAITLYRQALVRDPGFALARARLSYAESGLVWFGSNGSDTRKLVADAAAQAEQALAQQPDLVAAHLALGYSDYWGRHDYGSALKAFAAALKLRPNDADALAATGYVLRRQGHFDAAIHAMRQALELDPRNSNVTISLAETLAMVHRYAEAERFMHRAMALTPDNIGARFFYSQIILASSGDVTRALAVAQGDGSAMRSTRAYLFKLQRKYREALTLLQSIPDTPDNFTYRLGPKALQLADLYRLAGDKARARTLYTQSLPQSRARLAALAGNAMMLSFVWNHIAGAELGLGKTDAALAALAKSQALIAQSGDHSYLSWVTAVSAARYAQAGRADLAVPLLAKALATPGNGVYISPALINIDPAWDPIRRTPQFQALLKKYAKYRPVSVSTVAAKPRSRSPVKTQP